jgi:hypothetical protein
MGVDVVTANKAAHSMNSPETGIDPEPNAETVTQDKTKR